MLGAAYVTSWPVGVSATIACLAHEVIQLHDRRENRLKYKTDSNSRL